MNELLSNLDLTDYCKKLNIPLNGIHSKDLFNTIKPKLGCYIINLQDSNVGNGTHWTGLIIKSNFSCIYFDSFGITMPYDIICFVKRFNHKIKIYYSIDQIQHLNSIYCGWYCLYFLWFHMILYKKENNYNGYLINKHNEIFDKNNLLYNDNIIKILIKNVFNIK
jgi:hypothetical protein